MKHFLIKKIKGAKSMGKPASSEIKTQWQEKIHDQQKSGLSIQKWCDKNYIAPLSP